MVRVYLSLGSNLGNRGGNISAALKEMAERIGKVTKISSFYETEPWGFISQNKFINIAAEVETNLPPNRLLLATQEIETMLGRIRKGGEYYQDRVIDIDILLYGDEVILSRELSIPHPRMHNRSFVIDPLYEIAPNICLPTTGLSIKEIKDTLKE